MTNIQDEVMEIHHRYGTSEMANHKIQLLFEKYAKEYHKNETKNKFINNVNDKRKHLIDFAYMINVNDGDIDKISKLVDLYLNQTSGFVDNPDLGNNPFVELLEQHIHIYENGLEAIRDACWKDGETDKEKIADLKAIAYNSIYEVKNNIH